MSEKVRIYQLAKDIGIESKELLAILDDMGVEYKSSSSTLEADTADAVMQLVLDTQAEDVALVPKENSPQVAPPSATANEKSEAKAPAKKPVQADAPRRAPVVTVMGHVDHGKTSLLDYIRKTKVAEKEAGGITQHIGAYQAQTVHGPITFLDTPGHEAFTSIRQRGANATDIAVIVVAADDSIMPQTREAVAHAKAAKVPIIVAINKTDLPQANPDKVKQDLMQLELIPEDFGGDTIVVPISAMTGKGIDNLLEMISLVAELADVRAAKDVPAHGIIIESILDKRAGVLATILIQEGSLRVGDYIVSGEIWAKVRAMSDASGQRIAVAEPSFPVRILGFSEQPVAGDVIDAVATEAAAKALVSERKTLRQDSERETSSEKVLTLADLFGKSKATKINLILRADTQGSLEAIKGVLAKESAGVEEVDLDIMLAEVGAPTESDLLLASTADASVMSFGVTAAGSVKKAAERQGIPLKSYRIIYELIEDVQRMIRGQIEPEYEEKVLGHAQVRQVISVPRSGVIAGSYVTDGMIRRGAKARLIRAGKEVYKGSISQLRRFKDDVREVGTGFECGINLQNYDNVQEGDIIEVYDMVEVAA